MDKTCGQCAWFMPISIGGGHCRRVTWGFGKIQLSEKYGGEIWLAELGKKEPACPAFAPKEGEEEEEDNDGH